MWIPWFVLVAGVSGPPSAKLRVESEIRLSRPSALRPGDRVDVRIWRAGAAANVPVSHDGKLRHPLFGEVEVAGRTLAEIGEVIGATHGGAQVIVTRR